jgi:hypothetical protein
MRELYAGWIMAWLNCQVLDEVVGGSMVRDWVAAEVVGREA